MERTLCTQSQVVVNKNHYHCIYRLPDVSNDKIYRFHQIFQRSYFGRKALIKQFYAGHRLWRSLASFRTAASLFQVSPIPKIRIIPGTVSLGFLAFVPSCLSFRAKSSASLPCTLHCPGEVTVASLNQNTPDGFFFHQILPAKFHKWIARHGG